MLLSSRERGGRRLLRRAFRCLPIRYLRIKESTVSYHCQRAFAILNKNKKPVIIEITGFFGAVTQIRTGDLILTKDALYRLSYNSISHAPDEGGMVATEKGLEPSTSSVTG